MSCKFIKIFMINLFILNLFGCCRAEPVPTYRDFPVYPPERIKDIKGMDVFRLPVRNREKLLSEIEDVNFRVSLLSDKDKRFEMIDKAMKDINKEFREDIDEAENYLKQYASELGWTLDMESMHQDGGSLSLLFVLPDKDRIAGVTIWSGMMLAYDTGIWVSSHDEWGLISYKFSEMQK